MNEIESRMMGSELASVTVTAPARLHMGFMDMHGGLGRNFGSFGLTLSDINTRLTAVWSPAGVSCAGGGLAAQRAIRFGAAVLEKYRLSHGVHIHIHNVIPEHIGLGSGTQLGLAVGTAIARLAGLHVGIDVLGALVERGHRSGIGLGTFQYGGFVVDGGIGENSTVPPVICRLAMPESWRILLIFDAFVAGLSGEKENNAFQKLAPMKSDVSDRLCRLLLMRVLPALAERDIHGFGRGITEIQEHVGDYFAAYQGGRYCSSRVETVLHWLREQGITGLGQSSWGPTGFALIKTEMLASKLMRDLKKRFEGDSCLSFKVSRALNRGAEIAVEKRAVHVG